ncbi:unnamed protein product [Mycena citricolor]|uniref:Copper radical oxidase n=1 Tax=Mycena citricolor TaxID=2018698 RepID=A0AAD2HJW9_9AGAR|nr:unnamed protein product [Mycena citricolor]
MLIPLIWSLFCAAVYLTSVVFAKDSAWNGHTTPGSTDPAPFYPYYVPPGTKSYDSDSPLVLYSGKWKEFFSKSYIKGSIRQSYTAGASVSLTFFGTGIEWFGNCNRRHGISDVFIDGYLVQSVDAWCGSDLLPQQRIFWDFSLARRKHTIKIVNRSTRSDSDQAYAASVDAFVVTLGAVPKTLEAAAPPAVAHANPSPPPLMLSEAVPPSLPAGKWTLQQKGSTGVHAMQLAIISRTHAIIVDKVEHNPISIDGHPAWAALYNLEDDSVTPLAMESNSFCAGGTFLSNGTLIVVGGNPVVESHTSSADFGDVDGLQSIRIFNPCLSSDVKSCKMYENPNRIRMASSRWYNTVLRLSDGSAMIVGGSKKGGWINNATVNNPTVEYFPPKFDGMPVPLPVFMAANTDAIIYDWKNKNEFRLPSLPNGVRVTYPMSGTGLLLPLSPTNNYEPEVLICGGSAIDDTKPSYEISSQDPASSQCVRMILTQAGISAGWQIESMPEARLMPDAVLLPTGDIVIVNGAGSGTSGYGNVRDQVGSSNADHPVLSPVLYSPSQPTGSRFSSQGIPASNIPRLYHSVATLTPRGNVMIAGSNPNLDRSEIVYGTEYRVEWLNPPYMTNPRPEITGLPEKLGYGAQFKIDVKLPSTSSDIKIALMDFGYVTHTVHANSRLVYLEFEHTGSQFTITAPPNGMIYPPGPGWVFVVVDGMCSEGALTLVGNGEGPVVDETAIQNMLTHTRPDQYEHTKFSGDDE